MATLNDWQHAWLRIREFASVWYRGRVIGSDTSNTSQMVPGMENAMKNDKCAFDGDIQQAAGFGIQNWRAAYAGVQSVNVGRGVVDPMLLQLSRAMGYPAQDPFEVFPTLVRYMALNQGSFKSQPLVESRNFTRGNWSAGGTNVGNGTVYRLLVDAYGYPLEWDNPDVVKWRCTVDANSGANPGQEQFLTLGLPFQDSLKRYTSGYSTGIGSNISAKNLTGVTADNSRSFISNPSFSDSQGTGATFALTGWTIASGAFSTCSIDTAQYYRKSAVEGATPGALKTTATIAFKQKIPANKFDSTLAYLAQAACNFSAGGATGSVRMRIGTEVAYVIDVTVNSGVAGWNVILPARDKKLWFQNFNGAADLYVRFDITVSSGTYILLDDFSMDAFQNIGGKLLWAVGGTTPWVLNDTGTITDSITTTNSYPTEAKTQTMISELYGRSLPSTVLSTRPASPTIGTTTGGTGLKGKYGVVITFYNSTTGLESRPSLELLAYLDGTNDRINLTVIPAGPAGTTDRYIYITQADDYNDVTTIWSSPQGPSSAFYFAAALGDNVTATKVVNPSTIDLTKPLSVLADVI